MAEKCIPFKFTYGVVNNIQARISAQPINTTIGAKPIHTKVGTINEIRAKIAPQQINFNVGYACLGGGGTAYHGQLNGLEEDDHPQYLTSARGDIRYSPLGHNHDGLYDPLGSASLVQGNLDAHIAIQSGNPHNVKFSDLDDAPSVYPPAPHTIGSHQDVLLTNLQIDQGLKWNGTNWVNASGATGGVTNHADLDGVTADQHHPKSHNHNGVDGSGTVSYNNLTDKPYIPPAQTYKHEDLTDVSPDQHHAQAHAHDGQDGSGRIDYGDILNTPPAESFLHAALTDLATSGHPAKIITYDNTQSGLIAADVQVAIDALQSGKSPANHLHTGVYDPFGSADVVQANLDAHEANLANPHQTSWDNLLGIPADFPPAVHLHPATQITYSNFFSGLAATEVQSAIDELAAASSGGIHGNLIGLDADDHPQYFDAFRGDQRYAQKYHNHDGVYEPANANIQSHITDTTGNPHGITTAMIGAEPANANIQAHIADTTGNPHGITPAMIGADPAGTDNSIPVTLVGEATYLTLVEQQLSQRLLVETDVSDLNRIRWKNNWVAQEYQKNDMAKDGGYAGIANKNTSERLAPQPVGDPSYLFPDVPAWVMAGDTAIVRSGLRIVDLDRAYELQEIRVWVPTVTADAKYRLIVTDNLTGVVSVGSEFTGNILGKPGWLSQTMPGGNFLVPGSDTSIHLVADNSADSSIFDYPWNYIGISNQETDPGIGNTSRRGDHTILRISNTDSDSGDQTAALGNVIVGTTIRIVSDVSQSAYLEYEVTALPTNLGTWHSFPVRLIETGAEGEPDPGPAFNHFDIPVLSPTDYVTLPGHFAASPTVQGELFIDGVAQPGNEDVGFGVDLLVQEYTVSDDWDLLPVGSSGGSSGGGEAPATPVDNDPIQGNTGYAISSDWAHQHVAGTKGKHSYNDLLDQPIIPPAQTYLHADLTDINPNQHHNQVHALFGSDHSDVSTAQALANGDVLQWNAGSSAFFPFDVQGAINAHANRTDNPHAVTHAQLTGIGANDHHAELHDLGSHTDVTIGNPQTDQALVFNGTAWVNAALPSGVTDHGALSGLGDDDHPHYFNAARGDIRYAAIAHTHTGEYEPANSNIQAHIAITDGNPHGVKYSDLTDTPTLYWEAGAAAGQIHYSGGDIGIGIDNPADMLHVATVGGSGIVSELNSATNSAGVWIGQDGNGLGWIEGWHSNKFAASSSTNNLAIDADGSKNQIYLKTDGNVGIGTTSPGTKLAVAGQTHVTLASDTGWAYSMGSSGSSATSGLRYDSDNAALWLRDAAGNEDVRLTTQSGSDNWIRNGGNFGIGTNNPTHTLHVDGDMVVNNSIYTPTDAGITRIRGGVTPNAGAQIGIRGSTASLPSQIHFDAAQLNFRTGAAPFTTQRMTITGDGDVGIGTTSPSAKLDVAGDGRFTDQLWIERALGGSMLNLKDTGGTGSGVNPYMSFYDSADVRRGFMGMASTNDHHLTVKSEYGDVVLTGSNVQTCAATDSQFILGAQSPITIAGMFPSQLAKARIYKAITPDTNGNFVGIQTSTGGGSAGLRQAGLILLGDTVQGTAKMGAMYLESTSAYFNNPDLCFATKNLERMRIDYEGNVGIGTTTPAHALDVVGNIHSQGNIAAGGIDWAQLGKSVSIMYEENGAGAGKDWTYIYAIDWDAVDAGTPWKDCMWPLSINEESLNITGKSVAAGGDGSIGRVGVGTFYPDERLHVAGNIRIEGVTIGPDTTWKTAGVSDAEYRKLSNGVVEIRSTSTNWPSGSLPSGYRPERQIILPAVAPDATSHTIAIGPNGEILHNGGSSPLSDLTAIVLQFYADN